MTFYTTAQYKQNARDLATQLLLYPERYDQGVWFKNPGIADSDKDLAACVLSDTTPGKACSAKGCAAGHSVAMFVENAFFAWDGFGVYVPDPSGRYYRDRQGKFIFDSTGMSYGVRYRQDTVRAIGAIPLGLSYSAAEWLFAGHRTHTQMIAALRLLSEAGPVEVEDMLRAARIAHENDTFNLNDLDDDSPEWDDPDDEDEDDDY